MVNQPPGEIPPVLFGAAYYHEYQPSERLATDLDLMAAARFTVIRVGESVWSTWEPEDGQFDLEWLAPVLDGARERGIGVLLGTPTYAAPPWLQRKHPEIAAQRADGTAVPWGARQEIDFTSPVFRRYAERVVRQIVARYADHPAVIGYQVDNEPGLLLMHNPAILDGFAERLRKEYGTVEELNRQWGLTYWSHRLSDWSQLWPPHGNTTPSYDLAWRRYQADLTTDFITWQAGIVRELKCPGQFVTTCLAYSRPAVDDVALAGALDVTAGNHYHAVQDELRLPDTERRYGTWTAQGTWQFYLSADRMRGSRQAPFLVTETGATSISGSSYNYPPYDGQLRQSAWALVSRGARMVEYWHWHTLHYGWETYWGGVLGHSLEPGRIYAEAQVIGRELAAAAPALRDLRPDADVTFLRSLDSNWAMQYQPPLGAGPGALDPDPRSYDAIFGAFYQGFFDAGAQAGIVSVPQLAGTTADELARRHPVLVAPGLYIAGDETLELLDAYARAGGHLILTFRSGYADTEARARAEVAPGRLRAAVGAHYLEYSNLRAPVPVTAAPGGGLRLPTGARATGWADGLVTDDAEPLAWYDHPHFGRWPAATTRAHGAGRVTYAGTLPDHGFAVALARFAMDGGTIAERSGWGPPQPVRVTSAVNGAGERLWFVHHWSWGAAEVTAPTALTDVLTGEEIAADTAVALRDWDIRVFRAAR
ncbi:MAG TPA: beta-galactosidase [Trebonia sp.]|jgi:beta-galactosidase|nr:beta-galactosidase [Trebonia sp.]